MLFTGENDSEHCSCVLGSQWRFSLLPRLSDKRHHPSSIPDSLGAQSLILEPFLPLAYTNTVFLALPALKFYQFVNV